MNEQRLLNLNEAQQYRQKIETYQPSPEIIQQFAASNFGVIAGPTGVGKDTLRYELTQKNPELYKTVLSVTTRPPRELEVEGVDYRFRNLAFIDEGLKTGRFLQVAVVHDQQVSALDYGDIEEIGVGQVGLAILTVQTEVGLRHFHPGIKTLFLVTPDLRTLSERLNKDRTMAYEELQRRLHAAREEVKIALEHSEYQCIVNDEIGRATSLADEFLRTGQKNEAEDQAARQAAHQLLNELSI